MPRLRFTVRRMMVATGILGVLLGAGNLLWRHFDFLERADRFRRAAKPGPAGFSPNFAKPEEADREIAEFIAEREALLKTPRSLHYQALARKYEHAARYPWLPVAPDPPEPK